MKLGQDVYDCDPSELVKGDLEILTFNMSSQDFLKLQCHELIPITPPLRHDLKL